MSDSCMWSGPSRALQFHLDLFGQVDNIFKYLERLSKQEQVEVNTATLPLHLLQRLRLMTATTNTDGSTVVDARDNQSIMFSKDNWDRTTHVLKSEYKALNEGETHYVSHAVQTSVLAAAETLEPEPLFETDLPCPTGVIVFEYPLMMDDLHPETGELVPGLHLPVRAISWAQSNVVLPDGGIRQGIAYALYTDATAYERFYCGTYREILGFDAEMEDLIEGGAQLRSWMTDTSGWAFGVPWDNDRYGEGVTFIRRFLLSYFRWCWQRILVPTPHTPSRAERKWVARIKAPLQDGHIKVLRLRREIEHERKYGTSEYQGVYDHQFLVRGHWRRQWYKSLGPAKTDTGEFNPESHRLVYVEPFVKGNPNGPMILAHNVVAAVR